MVLLFPLLVVWLASTTLTNWYCKPLLVLCQAFVDSITNNSRLQPVMSNKAKVIWIGFIKRSWTIFVFFMERVVIVNWLKHRATSSFSSLLSWLQLLVVAVSLFLRTKNNNGVEVLWRRKKWLSHNAVLNHRPCIFKKSKGCVFYKTFCICFVICLVIGQLYKTNYRVAKSFYKQPEPESFLLVVVT